MPSLPCSAPHRAAPLLTPLLALLLACGSETPVEAAPEPTPPLGAGAPSVNAMFELLGGYRLDTDYASEGLALVTDADGYVIEAVAGAHLHTNSVQLYDLRVPPGAGTDPTSYPVAPRLRSWSVAELFPRWLDGQNLRDVAVVRTAAGYELAGIGRVFYNTSPRSTTQISIREITAGGTVLGATREIPVDLPEQEFSGFIKQFDSRSDLSAIGAGAYDSGQGSVAGLSYAVREPSGAWRKLLTPPAFGDLTSPRLPRDAGYSCPGGTSWVCIAPVGNAGVWSTERIGGGGVRVGDVVMFIATLGYGEREYSRQSYTFGDPARDRAVAYFFTHEANGTVRFLGYDRWSAAPEGQPVIGVALGRVRGVDAPLLFVVSANAWGTGAQRTAPMLQLFRIR
jgi:hypothetical protein